MGVGKTWGLPPPPPQEPTPRASSTTNIACKRCLGFFAFIEIITARTVAKITGIPRKGTCLRPALVVVATVTVKEPPLAGCVMATDEGFTEQVVQAGAPEHASVTVPVKVLGEFEPPTARL